jgi:putative two-component system response regulator
VEATGANATILVVDDALENLMVIEAILGDDYSLKLYEDARTAIEYAAESPPDLILLDIMMPDIDGFEACCLIKANAKLKDIPVIFITAKHNVRDEELGFSVGASDFIQKPISSPVVHARVKTHLKIKFIRDYLKHQEEQRTENPQQLISALKSIINNDKHD